tara:strand:+ start:1071 stop:1958 length:888 start_codon:yes stop_codon:yes gene_type:complete
MKRFHLIVNPEGGKKKGLYILEKILPIFEKNKTNLNILETQYVGHAEEYANTVNFDGYDGLCAIGGDGTMFELVNGMLSRVDSSRIPIGLITGGTGNAFMHDLDCLDPIQAVKRILKGNLRPIDIAEVITKERKYYSFNIIAWGLANDAATMAEKLRMLGNVRYDIASIIEVLRGRKRIAKLSFEDVSIEDDFVFILGCNTIHTGKGMKMAPHALLDDGKIDLVIVRKASKLKLLNLFPKLFTGNHIKSSLVDYVQVDKFSIQTEDETSLMIDGEIVGTTPCDISMSTKQINVLV